MIQSKTALVINGKRHSVSAQSDAPVLWVFLEHLKLTGTKYGCGAGLCEACTIHVNGKAGRSCQLQLSEVKGRRITNIEGLSRDGTHPLQKACVAEQVPQCGYHQSGRVRALAVTTPKRSALQP